jgi:hypothetical protein
MAEKIQILSNTPQNQPSPEKPEAPAAGSAPPATPPAEKQAPSK